MQDVLDEYNTLSSELIQELKAEVRKEFDIIIGALDAIDSNVKGAKTRLRAADTKNYTAVQLRDYKRANQLCTSIERKSSTKRKNLKGVRSKVDNLLNSKLDIQEINAKYLVRMSEVRTTLDSVHALRNNEIAEVSELIGKLP